MPKTRWVVLRWPNPSMAQMAEMSTEAFEDFLLQRLHPGLRQDEQGHAAAGQVHDGHTDKVRLKGPGDTDLTFSIKGIPAIPCDGHVNIPDGEVFTAPVSNSVNGVIHFNCPTIYRGVTHNDIRLVFKDGKIVEATSTATNSSTKFWTATPAPATSANSPSASTPIAPSR